MKKLRKICLLILFFYSEVGVVSGRNENVSLSEVIESSGLIVLASPVGKPESKRTEDGYSTFENQKFVVAQVLFSLPSSKQQLAQLKSAIEITVSNFDPYMYEIVKLSHEKGVNKIGLFRRYQSITQSQIASTEPRILFLEANEHKIAKAHLYVVPGSYESKSQLVQISKMISKRQSDN